MPAIMTVLGPITPSELGPTASHEHCFAESTSNRNDEDTRLDDLNVAVEELTAYKQAGGNAIVEVTTIDMGRDANRLAQLSAATGVKIIASTGFYKGNYSPGGERSIETWEFLPESLRQASVAELADLFIREVCQGIAETNVQAGIIGEIGTSYGRILEDEARVFRAAARANRDTGVPISTHLTLGTMGMEQVKILKEEGANLDHVVLSHVDLVSSHSYHVELARKGVFLGFDTAGKEQYQSDATRVELIRALIRQGFEDQIVLSCDICRRSLLKQHGGRGYVYLLEVFIPRLEAAGIDQAAIHKFLVENPRRLLAF
jgi:predicted metal-dependent phosphotriesterase family hydrolase